MPSRNIHAFGLAAGLLFAAVGCGGSADTQDAPSAPTTTAYTGTMASASESGKLTLSATSGAVSGALNLVSPGPSSVTLSGTLSGTSFTLAGGGYTFTGTTSGSGVTGTYTGPNGSGGFSLQAGPSTQVFVGTFTSTSGGMNGNFNIAINGGSLMGVAVSSDGSVTQLGGTATGGSLSVTASGTVIATGTVSGSNASGTYDNHQGNSGTWTGQLQP